MTSQSADMASLSNFYDIVVFFLSILVTGPSFMSISPLVLELWQFSFIKDLPEIRKLEIPPPEFYPISGDWNKLGIPNLARRFLLKCYWMLQNVRVTAFIVSESLKENQQRVKLPPTQIRVNPSTSCMLKVFCNTWPYLAIWEFYNTSHKPRIWHTNSDNVVNVSLPVFKPKEKKGRNNGKFWDKAYFNFGKYFWKLIRS